MNKVRQRKLEARKNRQESLANFAIASQEPKIYQGERVSVKKLRKIYMEIGLTTDQDVVTETDEAIKERNTKRNLAGTKKVTMAKGKEKANV